MNSNYPRGSELDLTNMHFGKNERTEPYDTDLQYTHLSRQATTVDDGCYLAEILGIFPRKTNKNTDRVYWFLKITDGPYASAIVEKLSNVTTKKSAAFLRNELEKVGLKVRCKEDLISQAGQAIGVKVELQVHTNSEGFPCYYISEIVGNNEKLSSCQEETGW